MRPLRMLAAAMALAAAGGALAQPRYPGERVLDLAGSDYAIASEALVKERLRALMDHLQLDVRTRARFLANVDPLPPRLAEHAGVPRAESRFEKSTGRMVLKQVTLAVIVARHDVVLDHVTDSIVIAGGNVRAGFASGSVIVARGDIDIAHDGADRARSGLYVTRGQVTISHAAEPIVYAMRGVKFSHFARVTAYNTDVREGGYGVVTRLIRPPAFPGELARREEAPSMRVDSGPQFAYTGRRCERGLNADAIGPYILKHAGEKHACARIESVEARCLKEWSREGAQGPSSTERWRVRLCGKSEEYEIVHAGNSSSMNNVEDLQRFWARHKPAARPAPPAEVQARTRALLQQASAEAARGERKQAMATYGEIIVLDPGNGAAFLGRGHLRSADNDPKGAIEDYDRALQTYPDQAAILSSRGLALLDAGAPERALEDLNAAVERDASSNTPLYNRAIAFLYLSNLPRALADFDRVVTRSPKNAGAYEMRMWTRLLAGQGAFEDAAYCLALREHAAAGASLSPRIAYAILGGYLALRQKALDDKALAWISERRSSLDADAWPGALVLHLSGELPLDVARRVAAGSRESLELQAFLGLDALFAGRAEEARHHFRRVIEEHAARYSFSRALAESGLKKIAR